jgi:hypothetical protein
MIQYREQVIQVEEVIVRFSDLLKDEIAPYETCTTSDNYFLKLTSRNFLST